MGVVGDLVSRFRQKYPSVQPKPREVVDQETGEVISRLDEHGREILDNTPVEVPIKFLQQPSLHDYVRSLVADERMRQELEDAGYETLEESEDFDTGEDEDLPLTRHEMEMTPEWQAMREQGVHDFKYANDPDYKQKFDQESAGEGAPPLPAEPKASSKSAKPSHRQGEGEGNQSE